MTPSSMDKCIDAANNVIQCLGYERFEKIEEGATFSDFTKTLEKLVSIYNSGVSSGFLCFGEAMSSYSFVCNKDIDKTIDELTSRYSNSMCCPTFHYPHTVHPEGSGLPWRRSCFIGDGGSTSFTVGRGKLIVVVDSVDDYVVVSVNGSDSECIPNCECKGDGSGRYEKMCNGGEVVKIYVISNCYGYIRASGKISFE